MSSDKLVRHEGDLETAASNNHYSVLMSVYKKENPEYLSQAVDSMLKQTVPPNQFVLVEDGTLTPELEIVISNYENTYSDLFTIVRNEKNQGLGKALDCGLKLCTNDLVARMDSDDISFPERCEKQLQLFKEYPEIDIVSGAIAEFIGTKENVVSHRIVPQFDDDIKRQMKRRSPFNHPAVMYKKSSVIRCGGYGESARKEDHDLFSRMMNQGCKGLNIQEDILYYRTGNESIKRRKSWKNVSSYIEIMWINLKRGYCSLWDFIYIVCAQLFYFLAPVWLIEKVLNKWFRE